MKKLFLATIIMIAFVSFVFLNYGAVANAATQTYQMLEGLPLGEGGATVNIYTATPDNFSNFLNSAFRIGIMVAIVLAIIVLVIGGIEYMGGDSVFTKEGAKGKFYNAITGLIMALAIFLFLNTINPDLVKLRLTMEPPQLRPAATLTTPTTPLQTAVDAVVQSEGQLRLNRILQDEQRVRTLIANTNVNIDINNGGLGRGWCTTYGQSGCTNVGLLPTFSVNRLDSLQRACGVPLVVTGGTEFWGHRTHGPGTNIVDLRKTTALEDCIKRLSGRSQLTIGETYSVMFPGGRGIFYNENALHFHVTFIQ